MIFPSDPKKKNDLLVSSNKVDVPKARSKFDFIFTQDLTIDSDWPLPGSLMMGPRDPDQPSEFSRNGPKIPAVCIHLYIIRDAIILLRQNHSMSKIKVYLWLGVSGGTHD